MSENKNYISREDEDKEVNLRDSEKAVGQLLPVILDAHGKPVDGLHRLESNPDWRTEQHPEIKTDEDYWKVRAHLNYVRRRSGEAKKEKKIIIEGLCEWYEKQGLRVRGSEPETGHGDGSHYNEVLDAVIKALNGAIKEQYIRDNFPEKYKQTQKPREAPLNTAAVVSAVAKIEPIIDLETPNGLLRAAETLKNKAMNKIKAQKTPEQIESEKAEKKRKAQEKAIEKKEQQKIKEEEIKKQREVRDEKIREETKKGIEEKIKELAKNDLLKDKEFIKNMHAAYKTIRKKERIEKIFQAPPLDIQSNIKILEGDFELECEKLDADSINYIITDPPYGKEYLELYNKLGIVANRLLKEGGSLIIMTGQSYLPEIYTLLTKNLNYNWTLAYLTPGGQSAQLWQRKINTFWKPILWFVKGVYMGKWIGDVTKSDVNANEKQFIDWQQSESGMTDIIERFTDIGDIILDPFMGSGTTGVIAIKLKRNFIGIDNKHEMIEIAKQRMGVSN